MKIATWNINSIRMRLARLTRWIAQVQPDVVCLQETKVVDELFPADAIRDLGYSALVHGQKTYNGVAILSRRPLLDPVQVLPGGGSDDECRFLSARVGTWRILNLYVPNGGEVGSEKYAYKMEWFARLRRHLDSALDAGEDVLVCGDFNVAPEDRDVWNPDQWRGKILCSEPEREAFRRLLGWGLSDTLRLHRAEGGLYTWWDYRGGAFHRGWGLRIDHILASKSLGERCLAVDIDRDQRKGEKPSDHAPVIATFV